MDLTLTDEQAALTEELRRVAQRQIRPAARACEQAGGVSGKIRSALADLGVAGVPEEFGGQGSLDVVTGVLLAEELAWGDPGVAYDVLSSTAAAWLIGQAGAADQRAALLPGVAAGRCAVALAEREGADLFALSTDVAEAGDRAALTGTKYAVAGFDRASSVLVVAGGPGGPSVWAVPAGALPAGASTHEEKLGLRSAATWRLRLDGVEVDTARSCLGGSPEEALRALLAAKLLTASINVGLARAAVEYASGYARERTAFGRPIGAFQGVSFMIAERAIGVDAARLLVWEAAAALDAGTATGDASRLVTAACGQAVTAAAGASDDAVQVLGGHGYMRDHPVELWYRDAMTLATLDAPWLLCDLFLGSVPAAGGRP
ncbi:MAG TPA: acyl-CoA dehydrogenase family protein [Actinomycetota bacterium]|nr:acyl-CoA dehydrogenase family protein [Actinomycetota bacterium]